MRGLLIIAGSVVAITTHGTELPAQAVPVQRLAGPALEFDTELSSVTDIRELSDGRVVVLDAREKLVHLFDPRTGTSTRIGREGSGPGEYLRPTALLALPGDSTLVADFGNSRYLVLGAGGRVLGTMPLIRLQPSPGVTYSMAIRAADQRGALYFALPRGLVSADTRGTPILRFDRQANRYDTVGVVAAVAATPPVSRTAGGQGLAIGRSAAVPFAAIDDWAVAPNGAVAFVRTAPYRVEWSSPSRAVTVGPTVAYERVRVGDAEKEAWRARARARGGPTLTTTGSDGRSQQQRLQVPEPSEWPEYKPPFLAPAALVDPVGRVWVARSQPASSKSNVYDVFDATGKLMQQIALPVSSTLAGFGKTVLFVAHRDEDDLIHLQQHRLPQ